MLFEAGLSFWSGSDMLPFRCGYDLRGSSFGQILSFRVFFFFLQFFKATFKRYLNNIQFDFLVYYNASR